MRYDYSVLAPETVLDLGGYRGDWTSEMLARFGCRAIVFEPSDVFFHALSERFAGDDRVTLCHFGLGAASRVEVISMEDDQSSIFSRNRENGQRVDIVDIADWWDTELLPAVAVLKLNIEGGEYEVLPRLIETGLIERVRDLQIQFHSFIPHAAKKMARITEALSRTHVQTYRYRYVWEGWRLRDSP